MAGLEIVTCTASDGSNVLREKWVYGRKRTQVVSKGTFQKFLQLFHHNAFYIFTREYIILLHRGRSSRQEQIITSMKFFQLLKCVQEYNPALIVAKIYRATSTCWVDGRTGLLIAYRIQAERDCHAAIL